MNLEQIGIQAKQVSYQLASLSTEQKNSGFTDGQFFYMGK
mgnify:CR=1 FL=1